MNAKFCEGCGALAEEAAVKEANLKHKDMLTALFKGLWKLLWYPLAICFVASFVLYWLASGLEYWGLARWAWIGFITPLVFFFGLLGLMAVSHPRTFHTTKEYILFSMIFLGVPIVLLTLTSMMFLGLLPFPIIEIEFGG